VAGGVAMAFVIGRYVWTQLSGTDLSRYIVFGVPLAVFAGVSALVLWIVNRPSSADFMIATEGEMKKVSWSSRREIIGGTKVVIATTLIMAVLLWTVDLAFGFFFNYINVLQISGGAGGR
jgi:preprotein translocase subunit SecE